MPDQQLERVFELKRRGDLDGALIALEGMLASTPSPVVLANLAEVQLRRGKYDEAAAAATWRRRAERTGDLYARKMLGFALRRAGNLDEAAGVLGSCLLEDPGNVILFRTYVHLQRQRGALEELRHTLESMLPVAGPRRGAVYRELRRLLEPGAEGSAGATGAAGAARAAGAEGSAGAADTGAAAPFDEP
ncbi:MAG: tetratricopeptide repeat protein [Acidimicrobiales bacterium]